MDTVLELVLLGLVILIINLFRKYSKNELSGLGCAFGSLFVTGLVFLLYIILAIRGCEGQFEKEAEYWKDKTACDCIKAYEKNEISIDDLFDHDKGCPQTKWQHNECNCAIIRLFGHPCETIVDVSSEDFGYITTKSDTIMALKNVYNCD